MYQKQDAESQLGRGKNSWKSMPTAMTERKELVYCDFKNRATFSTVQSCSEQSVQLLKMDEVAGSSRSSSNTKTV